ncbi:MAG: cation:proton antiporter [bacterium]|nr:cation:proton antiporter [bacterium]
MDDHRVLLFLLQLLLLLGSARGLGLVLARYGQPALTAEILVGILFGPTVLGRLWPAGQAWLFPCDAAQQSLLEAVAWLGLFFFLLDTGLQTDFGAAWQQRRQAALISMCDLIIPIVVAFVPCMLLPARFLVDPQQRVLFAVFTATIMTISALPVTARVLQDLYLYRTDVGLLIMGALTINDVAGWVVFAIILGIAGEAFTQVHQIPLMIVLTVGFAVSALTFGRRLTNRLLEQCARWSLPEPGTSLTLVCLLGLLGGAITTWIGVHALFGFFIAGIMAGEARALKESTRQVIHQMVGAVLVPIFFTTVGLRVDFARAFDVGLVGMLLGVGVAGRFLGAWIGSWVSRQPRSDWTLIAAAHTPGGEMQIVIGLMALQFGVISEHVYAAVVVSALISSMALGPWMRWALKPVWRPSIEAYFRAEAVILELAARERDEALRELCRHAASLDRTLDRGVVSEAVVAREAMMGTALGGGIAVPHARLANLRQPLVVMGRARHGIDWNAPDGQPADLLFLVLTHVDASDQQIHLLGAIAKAVRHEELRRRLRAVTTAQDFVRHLTAGMAEQRLPSSSAPHAHTRGESAE